jgi:hypothetical protein
MSLSFSPCASMLASGGGKDRCPRPPPGATERASKHRHCNGRTNARSLPLSAPSSAAQDGQDLDGARRGPPPPPLCPPTPLQESRHFVRTEARENSFFRMFFRLFSPIVSLWLSPRSSARLCSFQTSCSGCSSAPTARASPPPAAAPSASGTPSPGRSACPSPAADASARTPAAASPSRSVGS